MKTSAVLCSFVVAACGVEAYVPRKWDRCVGGAECGRLATCWLLSDAARAIFKPMYSQLTTFPLFCSLFSLLDRRDRPQARSGTEKGGCECLCSLYYCRFGHHVGAPAGRCPATGVRQQQYDGGGESGP